MNLWNRVIGLAVLLTGCVESFDLPVQEADVRFLVIDGFLNTSGGEVSVNLHRAAKITETDLLFELNAVVVLEDSDGNSYLLNELGSGNYRGATPSPEVEKKYRLYIKTADGKEYRSQFVTQKPAPEIKEVGWKAMADGVQITVDTEGIDNDTRYYRWTFEETWEYHSEYISYWEAKDGEVDTRDRNSMIDVCYRAKPSAEIYTTSTSGFTEDKVNDFELSFLPKGTEKLSHQYSILVRQHAISKETYEYLERLKKTSQNLGGLFDPQPSKVTGNISNISDPSEVVLGYFDAGQSTQKRMFISHHDLPAVLQTTDKTMFCSIDTVKEQNLELLLSSNDYLLLHQLTEGFAILGYTYTTNECADCRLKGGVTAKPDFWP